MFGRTIFGFFRQNKYLKHFKHHFSDTEQFIIERPANFKQKYTINDIKEKLTTEKANMDNLMNYEFPSLAALPPRLMADSYDEITIPFVTDKHTRLSHISVTGLIRHGRLLEDLDIFAVWLAYKHLLYPGVTSLEEMLVGCVTAYIESVKRSPHAIVDSKDLLMRGHVTWCDDTSMETSMVLYQENPQNERYVPILFAQHLTTAYKTTTTDRAFVNPIVASTKFEKKLFSRGVKNNKHRLKHSYLSILKFVAKEGERRFLHELFIDSVTTSGALLAQTKAPDAVLMRNARFSNTVTIDPEHRHVFKRVFSGTVLRNAYELASALIAVFTGTWGTIVGFNDISYVEAHQIGDKIRYDAYIGFTYRNFCQVYVTSRKLDFEKGTRGPSNQFLFTFTVKTKHLPKVLPHTYPEAAVFIYSINALEALLDKQIDPYELYHMHHDK